MKKFILFCLLFTSIAVQAQKPDWEKAQPVGNAKRDAAKPYTIVLYGALGCGYSQQLMPHMARFADCDQAQVVLLLDDERNKIVSERPTLADSLVIYSNKELKHQFKKDNDIFPQLMVYRSNEELQKIKGMKKNMIVHARRLVGCPNKD